MVKATTKTIEIIKSLEESGVLVKDTHKYEKAMNLLQECVEMSDEDFAKSKHSKDNYLAYLRTEIRKAE